jgi:hypothetical protein
VLQVDRSIISRDIAHIRQQSKDNIRKYIDERLPEEYEKCLVGLTAILRKAWNTSQHTEDRREKIQALSLAKECYSMKLDLLTNATVVEDAIRLVSEKSSIEPVLEKYKIDDSVTIDKNRTHDIQRSEEEDNKQLQQTATTNTVF